MLSTVLSILIIFMLIKVLFQIGFGITKIIFSLIGMMIFLFLLPIGLILIVPLFGVMAIIFLLKIIF